MINVLRFATDDSVLQRRTEIPQITKQMELNSSSKGQEMKSICLLGPGFGTNNMGLNALTTGTVTSALNTFPQARLWLLDYDDWPNEYEVFLAGGRTTIPMVNMQFSKRVYSRNHIAMLVLLALISRAIPSAGIKNRFLASNACLWQISQSDMVVALSGGDSFSDIYGLERLWYVSLPQILTVLLKRPLVLLPQTIGPFKTAVGRSIARRILQSAQRIYTRDAESLNEVARLLGHKPNHALLAYDMAFVLDPLLPPSETVEQIRNLRQAGQLVGLNVSGLLYAGGYTGRNQFGLRVNYREMIRDLVKFFVGQGAQVLLVPHVLGKPESLESDIAACDQVFRDFSRSSGGQLHNLRMPLDHHQLKWVIGQCDFFLGSRMHACIAAISEAVPAIGLAYSRKFKGVFSTLGVEDLVVDLTNVDLDGVAALVENRFRNRHDVKARLESAVPKIRSTVLDLFKNCGSNNSNLLI
ncbi:MAG: polysaccharide pyruvyl transferase family protein [Verrucomicrobiota bacterium]